MSQAALDGISLVDRIKKQNAPVFNWRGRAFDKQISFIEDPARLKASWTTRRGAKSYADGIYLIKEAQEVDACNCLYLGLTRISAKAIIWKDVLKDINRKDSLDINFNGTELTATTQNGSIIYVSGVDVDEDERKKLFGRKYRLVVIDEAALYKIDLRDLVYVVLKPAMADMRGTIVLSGMSSNITQGLFYDITTRKEKGWSLHTWTAHDNPFIAKQWQEELDDITINRPEFKETARYKQAYLNQWVIDEDAKVYKFVSERNRALTLPQRDTPYHYVLGIDLGHSPDPTAFVIGAYHDTTNVLYLLHAEKHLEFDVTDVAEKIKSLEKTLTFDVKVVDNANKQAVAELNTRHGSNLIAADKTGKSDFINLMNDEFIQKKIMLLNGANELATEYDSLVWETEDGRVSLPRKEHESLPNHHTDAALYLWRYCHQYLFKEPDEKPRWGTQEHWEPEHLKKLEEQVRQQQNPNHLDLEFDSDLFNFSMDESL